MKKLGILGLCLLFLIGCQSAETGDIPIPDMQDGYHNFYEIYVGAFYDTNDDGIGDLQGVTSKLDYVHDTLGFDGIWLMPVMPSPTYHKYDVMDYQEIDKDYGTLEDMVTLLETAHNKGMVVIIDLVLNHTSTKHPWFVEATKYLKTLGDGDMPDPFQCPEVAYYHFVREEDKKEGYHQVAGTNWYYEGVFWDQMPDLNLDNEQLRHEIEGITDFWLEKGVDGFRLDAAKEFYTGETSRNVETLSWFSDYVTKKKPEAYIVGEVWDSKNAISQYYASGITSLFDFPMARYNGIISMTARQLGGHTATDYAQVLVHYTEEYAAQNPEFIDAPFISNHDTTRISAQCVNDEAAMKYAAGLLFMMNGNPFVYYGEEIGMNSMGDKDENKRLPMHWSKDDVEGIPKPVANADDVEQKFLPVDQQLGMETSLLEYYRRGILLRRQNPEIARGEVHSVPEFGSKTLAAVHKIYDGTRITIVFNMDPIHSEHVLLEAVESSGKNIYGYLTLDNEPIVLKDKGMNLPPRSIVILR